MMRVNTICTILIARNLEDFQSISMVSVLASSALDRGFEPRSGQTIDYAIGICYFSANHTAIRRKSND